jgi:biotin carboxyl carrier protein
VTTAATTTTTTTTAPPTTTTTVPTRWTDPQWSTMASVGGIALLHPSTRVERIGFHQSNHEGARELEVAPTAVQAVTLESRERLTPARTAADVVVEPGAEIRSPVSGVVKRAGTYTLYCKYSDDYLVIAPDVNPAWEVKLLHIDGVAVQAGQRVEAGVTVVAPRPTILPFESQVDEARTAEPAWPHVHVEVVDPSIPNVSSPGGGC